MCPTGLDRQRDHLGLVDRRAHLEPRRRASSRRATLTSRSRVDGPGTGDGFELFCNGETDINDASRPIEDDEIAACEENGIDYTELEVGLDGLTVMGNPANAVTCLNSGDLYALFGPESEGIDTWNGADALASEVGGNGGFPDAPLDDHGAR